MHGIASRTSGLHTGLTHKQRELRKVVRPVGHGEAEGARSREARIRTRIDKLYAKRMAAPTGKGNSKFSNVAEPLHKWLSASQFPSYVYRIGPS